MPRLSKHQVETEYQEPSPDLSEATSFLQSKFKVPRKDAKGISAHVNFYTAPYYVRIAMEILTKVKDFKTPSDVYACALHYGLKWLQDQAEVGPTSVQSQLNAWMRICQEAETDEELMLMMEMLRETVNRKLGHGAKKEAKRIVALARYETERMPDGYYKERALEFLDGEFEQLYNEGEAAKAEDGTG